MHNHAVLKPLSGPALLSTFEGWWDAAGHVSGNLINRGTAGATLDFVMGAGGAAPAFAAGVFTFDGVDDVMTVADNATLDIGNNVSFSMGCVIQPVTALAVGKRIMAKDPGSGVTYMLRGTTAGALLFNVNDGTTSASASTVHPTTGHWPRAGPLSTPDPPDK